MTTFPPPATLERPQARAAAYRLVNERTAWPVALGLLVLAAVGDALTTAEAAFTLVYLIPIAIVTWFHGAHRAYGVVAIAVACSITVDLFFSQRRPMAVAIATNIVGEAILFLLYSYTLGALRKRIDAETHLRQAALGQLRHAERLTTIGKLASGVAHELGTPLNVIAGRAEMMTSGRFDAANDKRSAEVILEQTERMAHIIRQLLDFARRGGEHPQRENLKVLCARTADLLRPLAKRSNVEIDVAGEDVSAAVNSTELQQVLSNLISNAMHAMPKGGHIEITTTRQKLAFNENEDREPRDYLVIEVRDHGTGIAPEVLPHVFDPFFTTKPVGEGTGLGLSVSFGIVRDHGGAMSLDTALGRGTTVRVALPAD